MRSPRDYFSKYMQTPNHEPMMISPQNDGQLLDNYQASISKRNQRNRSNTYENEESMDETDVSRLAQLSSNSVSLTNVKKDIDNTESSDDKPSRTYVNRPGGAVKIYRGDTIQRKGTTRESSSGRQPQVGTPENPHLILERTVSGSLDAPDTEKEISTYDELNSDDSSTLSLSNSSRMGAATGKDYNEMIKFVFTEHGIRVISDKEYVV